MLLVIAQGAADAAMLLSAWDYVAFFGYVAALGLIGYLAGRGGDNEDAADYFLAGRSLPWYVVGSSYIAANISTEHFLGAIGAAVIYGICVATGEWSTVIAFTFMIWLFIPYMLGAKVYTAPEFLEKRLNREMRLIFAVVTVVINVVAIMGPVIYGGGLALEKLMGIGINPAILIVALASGFWAIWGGMRSVALMDLLTIAVMVTGGLSVTLLGFWHLGEGEGLLAGAWRVIEINRGNVDWARDWIDEHGWKMIADGDPSATRYNRLSVVQPITHEVNPWTHWAFSFFYIGLWYTVMNQFLIQKVLAAKDAYHARMGMVFASFLKLLLPFIIVVPGLIFFAMRPEMLDSGDLSTMKDDANAAYVIMVQRVVPTFFVGVFVAALFGAIQSTISAVLSSTATVVTVDFYKRLFRPDATPSQEVVVGRIAGVVVLAVSIGIATVLAFGIKVNLFVWIQQSYVFFAPPFSAVFLLAVVWRRFSGLDAIVATLAGFGCASALKVIELQGGLPPVLQPFANQGTAVWVVSLIVGAASAFFTPPPRPEQIGDDLTVNWKDLKLGDGLGDRWYSSVTLWWGLSFALMVVIAVVFSVVL